MTQIPGSRPPGPSPYPAGYGPGTGTGQSAPASSHGVLPGYGGYGSAPTGQPLSYAASSPGPLPGAPGHGGNTPSRPTLRGPVVLLVTGLVLLLLGVGLFVYASLRPAVGATSLSQFNTGYEMQASLEGGTAYGLYYDDSGSTPDCQVTSPQDDDVSVSTNITDTVTINDHTLFATFVTNEAGDYTVTCTSSTDQDVYIGLTTRASDVFRLIGGVLVAQVATALTGAAGLVMTVVGLIWLTRRRSARGSQPPATTPPIPAHPGAYGHTQAASTGYTAYTAPGQGYSPLPGNSDNRAVPTSLPTSPATDAQQPPAGGAPAASPPTQVTGPYYGGYQGGHSHRDAPRAD